MRFLNGSDRAYR